MHPATLSTGTTPCTTAPYPASLSSGETRHARHALVSTPASKPASAKPAQLAYVAASLKQSVASAPWIGDPSDAGYTCAAAVQAAWACAEYACKSSCPVSDDPSRAAYVACTELAATGVCSAYTQLAQACVAAEVDGGSPTVAMYCFDGANDAGETLTLLDFFCGT